MNKKAIIMAVALVASLGLVAAPHHGGHHGGPRGGGRPVVMHHHGHHHGHHSVWGRGGRNFWPGFVGGAVGAMIYDTVRPRPVVVTTPVVTTPVVTTPVVTTPVVTTPVVTTPVVTTPVVTTPVVTTPVATTQSVWVEGRYIDQVQPSGAIVRIWQPGHYEQRTVYVQ